MPHGLSRETLGEKMRAANPVFVRPLSESNKSKKPMKVLSLHGHYANLEIEVAGRKKQQRVAIEKLEFWNPTKPEPKVQPKPESLFPVPDRGPITIAESKPPEPEKPKVEAPPPAQPAPPVPPTIAARRAWTGPMRWVVMHGETHRFYTEKHKWTDNIEEGRHYESEAGANRAAGHLRAEHGRCKGQPIVGLRKPDAYAKLDLLAKKAAEPKPEMKEPETITVDMPVDRMKDAARVIEAALDRTEPQVPQGTAPVEPPHSDLADLQLAMEQAMRAEHEAWEVMQRRKIERRRVQLEIDLRLLRKKSLSS